MNRISNDTNKKYCFLCARNVASEPHTIISTDNGISCICGKCGQRYEPELRGATGLLRLKEELLNHYAKRRPTEFFQFDAFMNAEPGDPVALPDQNGNSFCSCLTTELMSGGPTVRILITKDDEAIKDKYKVASVIREISEWVIKDGIDQLQKRAGIKVFEIPF
jgi:hypothetical protein